PDQAMPQLAVPLAHSPQKSRRLNPVHILMLVTGSILIILLLIGQNPLLGTSPMTQFQRLWLGLLLILLGLNRVNWWRGLLLTSGFGLMVLLAEINGIWLPDETIPPVSSAVQLGLLIGGGVLLALGLDRRGDQPYTSALTRTDW